MKSTIERRGRRIGYLMIGLALGVLAVRGIDRFALGPESGKLAFESGDQFALKDIVDSEQYTKSYVGTRFPVELVPPESAVIDSLFARPFALITVFSTVGCSVCLDDELDQVARLYKQRNHELSVFGVAHSNDPSVLVRFRRASKIPFPIVFDRENAVASYLHIKSLPVTFLVETGSMRILAANHPVRQRLEWSDSFYMIAQNYLMHSAPTQ
ncbi:MAG: hypothetical protein R2832_18590 [Rhodothermales bacterium]